MALDLIVPVAPATQDGQVAHPAGTAGASGAPGPRPAAGSAQPRTLRRLGLLSNRKRHGDIVLEELAARVQAAHPGVEVVSRSKPNYSLPAPEAVLRELAAGCDAVLSSIGD